MLMLPICHTRDTELMSGVVAHDCYIGPKLTYVLLNSDIFKRSIVQGKWITQFVQSVAHLQFFF